MFTLPETFDRRLEAIGLRQEQHGGVPARNSSRDAEPVGVGDAHIDYLLAAAVTPFDPRTRPAGPTTRFTGWMEGTGSPDRPGTPPPVEALSKKEIQNRSRDSKHRRIALSLLVVRG